MVVKPAGSSGSPVLNSYHRIGLAALRIETEGTGERSRPAVPDAVSRTHVGMGRGDLKGLRGRAPVRSGGFERLTGKSERAAHEIVFRNDFQFRLKS